MSATTLPTGTWQLDPAKTTITVTLKKLLGPRSSSSNRPRNSQTCVTDTHTQRKEALWK